MEKNSYTQRILDNGLTVILKEIHSAPVISHWIWYRVGSRNEKEGKTGLSHWVEHMQFKGTERFSSEEMDRMISRHGGHMNAFTYLDWTAFYETMPAQHIELAVEMEADRMTHSLFLPEDVEPERTVVISEREGQENEPTFRLNEAVRRAAFPDHPYGREIVGEKDDLYGITRDDLYNYYRTFYAPNNAVLTMAGDFDTDEMLHIIDAAYGGIPLQNIPSCDVQPSGLITAPQLLEECGPCDITTMQMVWRAPAGNDPDVFPMTIFDSVLSGPSSLNMFGRGSVSNRTSRFYQKLVKAGLAVAIGGGYVTTIDPYMYTLSAFVLPGRDPAEISAVVNEEINSIIREGISEAELAKAKKQAKAMFAYSCENITNQAYWFGYSSMFAEPSWYTDYLENLNKVTVEDVSRFAAVYFQPQNCVTGIYKSN
ncbi:MAG: insulinase family protein [Anaerolineaceae bacterium]|nr:insulinase family protein [Anaerolineaceae bacterium]